MRIAVAGGTGAVGRHIVEAAGERGHDVLTLSRSAGIDLMRGTGTNSGTRQGAALDEVLRGTDAVIDVTSVQTQSARASEEFFGTVTKNLLAAEHAAGVGHHIALSIVGSDKAPFGYYAGKALQERLVAEGGIPFTVLRATQFHEFAKQIFGQAAIGRIHLVPKMTSQPVAASEVAERLVGLAERSAAGRSADMAGPEVLRMADMVKAYSAAIGARAIIREIPLPGGFGKALRDGTILPDSTAVLGRQTFAEWVSRQRAERA